MMMTTYVKELIPGGESPYQNYQWPLPTQDEPGAWVKADTTTPLERCGNGLHAYTEEQAQAQLRHDRTYWEIEYTEPPRNWGDKVSGYRARLLRPYPVPAWLSTVQPAIDILANIPWLKPDGNPDPSWKLFPTRDAARYAAGKAARAAAWDAAGDAAWNAAWNAARAAAWNAARAAARAAAGDAARDAAWDAAWAAAWNAARAAAWNAARDAAWWVLMTTICADLPIDARHRDYVDARMNVWRKGYGVLAEVNGGLYVYERIR